MTVMKCILGNKVFNTKKPNKNNKRTESKHTNTQ